MHTESSSSKVARKYFQFQANSLNTVILKKLAKSLELPKLESVNFKNKCL